MLTSRRPMYYGIHPGRPENDRQPIGGTRFDEYRRF
jgi:hypothetical protein